MASRAAKAIGGAGKAKTFIDYAIDYSKANAPLAQDLYAEDVGASAAFLLSPLARAITGTTLYVDNGLSTMGKHSIINCFVGLNLLLMYLGMALDSVAMIPAKEG